MFTTSCLPSSRISVMTVESDRWRLGSHDTPSVGQLWKWLRVNCYRVSRAMCHVRLFTLMLITNLSPETFRKTVFLNRNTQGLYCKANQSKLSVALILSAFFLNTTLSSESSSVVGLRTLDSKWVGIESWF